MYRSILLFRDKQHFEKASLHTTASADFVAYYDEAISGYIVIKDRYKNEHRVIPEDSLDMIFNEE